MKVKGYSLCNGQVFVKIKDSVHTSVYCCSAGDFIHRTLKNAEVANAVACRTEQVIKLLSNPSCRMIDPLKIDFNLIEVLPAGTCFHIAGKRFVKYDKLTVSPRAFVKYTYKQ